MQLIINAGVHERDVHKHILINFSVTKISDYRVYIPLSKDCAHQFKTKVFDFIIMLHGYLYSKSLTF